SMSLSTPCTPSDLPSSPTRRSSDLHQIKVGHRRPHQTVFARRNVEQIARAVLGLDFQRDAVTHDGLAHGFAEAPARLTLDQAVRSEEHTSELQSRFDLVCRLLLEKK